jgi:DNA gyrase inhibitor GyrI
MIKKIFTLLSGLLLAGCSLFGIQSEDSPTFWLADREDSFEIRHYQPYLVAQTEDSGSYDVATKQSFDRLFGYITGKNQGKQKIAMTTPVQQQSKAEKIEMTAPVFQEKSGKAWAMAFVMPSQYNIETVPKPTDPKVIIKEIPEKRVAVLKFSGFLNEGKIAEKKAELMVWLKQKHIKATSDPISAGYNPPWTIPFLRRNEIHVDIQ